MTQSKQDQGNSHLSQRKAASFAVMACEVSEKSMLEAAAKCREAGMGDISSMLEDRARQVRFDQEAILNL
jgi:hypothetical protein